MNRSIINCLCFLTEIIVLAENDNVQIEMAIRVRQPYERDIALWSKTLGPDMIDYYITNKPENIGDIANLKKIYKTGKRTYIKNLNENHFYMIKKNGIKEKREWLIYSATSKCVYCYICKLFPVNIKQAFVDGISNWGCIANLIKKHETSKYHMEAMWTFVTRKKQVNCIDTQQLIQYEKKCSYWREVLRRIVATVKLLSRLGLAFRSHDETKYSEHKGNFITCIEYLAEFDEFLKQHLKSYQYCGSGKTNFLSKEIYNEFLVIMSDYLRKVFIDEIIAAKYFSVIVDSTPDMSHIDQLTLIIRYVDTHGHIVERFLGFIPIKSHKADYLARTVLDQLKTLGLNIKNCRGQSYDNAANMSGQYTGLQARLKKESPSALYVPCSSHSLNLVGSKAAESCLNATKYFSFVQNIFTYLSASTHRWEILRSKLQLNKKTVKRVCDTRWSARADAVSALKESYKEVSGIIRALSQDESEKPSSKLEAETLTKNFRKFENAVLTVLWNRLLQQMNRVSKSLQAKDLDLLNAVKLFNSLQAFIKEVRNDYSSIESDALLLIEGIPDVSSIYNAQTGRQPPRKRRLNDEETIMVDTQKSFVNNTINIICDMLIVELEGRKTAIESILNNFQVNESFVIIQRKIRYYSFKIFYLTL